ncbi:glycosyltransferase family 35 protein [Meredithblackwellia eburnea MCA 4105]
MAPPPPSPRAINQVNTFEHDVKAIVRPRVHKRSATGFVPEGAVDLNEVFPGDAATWKTAVKDVNDDLKEDSTTIANSIVKHVATTLARAPFNVDDLSTYQATALSVRDRLIARWNDTQTFHTQKKPKRIYYFSLEFLMGKSLDNALLNLSVKDQYQESIKQLGFQMEDILDAERDAGLGNGGLGRLAACYMDSLSTLNIPAWGYGLRYQYGIFKQLLDSSGAQLEVPDPWLDHSNPWEIARLDTAVEVKFYGEATRGVDGKGAGSWTGGLEVLAVPYDLPIPGFKTQNTNNIRLWASKPKKAFDLARFNAGDYDSSVREAEQAENITRVLYPNDNTDAGKALRLKQQYFWVSASLMDIIRRFKKLGVAWSEFSDFVAIQLNDTHPTMAIVELMRVLVDEEAQPWDDAWAITQKTFGYTNHTVMPEALEKWSVPLISSLLPRHMQIIFDINLFWLQAVEKKFPGDRAKLARMSLIEEGYPQQVRMAYLAVIGSHKVNGVAELHSGLVKEMMHDFVDYFGPDHFTNVTNGITARRWLLQCNPALAALITSRLGNDEWLTDLYKIKGIEAFADEAKFQKAVYDIKQQNKDRLASYIEKTLGIPINRNALFDVMCKRIHEYKRQFLNILGTVYRYLQLKKLSPAERAKVVPRVSIFAGKAAPGYYIAKLIIRLINAVSKTIQADKEVGDALQVVFIPDYSVGLAEIIIPASDISEHISTAGTEASGTSNMKFCLNGGLLLGTADGANIEIAEEVGEPNIFFFGNLTPDVPKLRRAHHFGESQYPPELIEAIDAIRSGQFGEAGVFEPLLSTLFEGKDFYLVSDDFTSYLEAQRMIDVAYVDRAGWAKKTIHTIGNMGKFASDRSVAEYCDSIWSVEPLKVPARK